jgi:hypothetical protein
MSPLGGRFGTLKGTDISNSDIYMLDFQPRSGAGNRAMACCNNFCRSSKKNRQIAGQALAPGSSDRRFHDRGLPFSGSYKDRYPTASTFTG